MIKRDELIDFIHQAIGFDLINQVQSFDISANGVQVFGKKQINKVAAGVSINLEFIQKAIKFGADFLITHHGINLSNKYIFNSRLDLAAQKRLRLVFTHDLTVAAYHAALDIQPDFGNNASIIKLLGAHRLDTSYYDGWGWVGEFETPVSIKLLQKKCEQIFSHPVYTALLGNDLIKRIGVCSGGSKLFGRSLFEAKEKQIDLHITGEIVENLDHLAVESEINYFACGHYATETLGVKNLCEILRTHYGNSLDLKFIDIPSEL